MRAQGNEQLEKVTDRGTTPVDPYFVNAFNVVLMQQFGMRRKICVSP